MINKYVNPIKSKLKLDDFNDDSLGANYYCINELRKSDLSDIAILELEKLGYKLNI